jgi:hypothetical protein
MNRLRVLFLSLFILALVAGALPVTESLAKWSRHAAVGHNRRHRRHSRAWWRRHRALVRARRERVARLRQQRLAVAQSALTVDAASQKDGARAVQSTRTNAAKTSLLSFDGGAVSPARAAQMPFDFVVPNTWTPARRSRAGAAVFSVQTSDGRSVGTAVIAAVSLSASELAGAPSNAKTKTVGGVPVTALRRTVIDRMVAEGGWVTNDLVQEIHGRRVFIVLAQTGAPGAPAQSWAFYFTEIEGRVYSLATNAPIEFAEPVAAGSVQFMASLRPASDANTASRK